MKITIEPTPTLTTLDGMLGRLWTGTTENGVLCEVFVPAIRIREGEDQTAFDRELISLPDYVEDYDSDQHIFGARRHR